MNTDVTASTCSRCGAEPRLRDQRWGRHCLTAAQRERRAARRQQQPPRSALTSPAVERYRAAVLNLERVTRETDWRRSRYTPATVLAPLLRAVTQAEAECDR